MAGKEWIESHFNKKECAKFVSSKRDPRKCGCGRSLAFHRQLTQTSHLRSSANSNLWNSKNHTVSLATDAYGLLEFQGAGHGNKAKYIRLADDTSPELILHLLKRHWNLGLPNLLISMRGGLQDFAMQPKLKRVLCKGLSKAARTTGAWIITGGTNTGVTMLVGNALNNHSVKMRGRVVTIGIAPWGVLNSRESLIGQDTVRPYHSVACPVSKGFKLNSHHTHFLLVDNGTVDQYGCEMLVRRKFEKYLSMQHVSARRQVPVVSLVVEGGANVVRTVLANVSGDPPIPVVVFDGTGRAADIIAFMHKYTNDNGHLSAPLKEQLLETIKHTFDFTHRQSEKLYEELEQCMKNKDMITVFCLGTEGVEDFDLAILTALLKAHTKSYSDQLNVALSWDRVDIAKKQIFVHGRDWPEGVLDQVMMDALTNNKVEFVKLLKDNGVNMHKFLTVARLEELYNTKHGPASTLPYLVKDVRKHHHLQKYSLYDVGLVFENLMGGTYQSSYTDRRFKALHQSTLKKGLSFTLLMEREVSDATIPPIDRHLKTFPFPFNELFIWAILTKRQKMARFFWQQDEDALAKALVASSLYRAMAKSAEVMNLEGDISGELRRYAQEFMDLALDLLDRCYKEDEALTMQLLTVQLDNWSKHTGLSLAAMAQHNLFMAHSCCQVLLNDLWHGGMQAQKYINIKVITSLLFPVCIFGIGFKSTEELLLMPQTLEEHMQDVEDADRPSITSSTSFTRLHNIKEEEEIPMERTGLRQRLTVTSKDIDPIIDETDHGNKSRWKTSEKRQLSGGKKLYEFFNAPITKFWSYTIFYLVFMFMYNYVCLFRMEAMPSFFEWIVILYIITTGMEHVRELMLAEPTKLSHKFRVFYSVFWNIHDVIAIVTFMIGFILRMVPSTHQTGRVVYCVVIVLWYLRFLEILSVSNYLGPLINMIGKMLRDMCYFLVVLIIILVSFGVIRQSILNPDVDPAWWPVREVLHEPYWMIYGEVYAGKINPPCGDGPDMVPCHTGRWVVPIAMSIYCLVANILIVNMLIALFNTTFQRIMPISNQIWKFQRYHVTMKYEQKPILVPPFTIIYYLYSLFKFVVCQCRKCEKRQKDIRLKLFLGKEAMDSVRDFEEACLELYLKDKESERQVSSEERLREIALRTEDHSYQLEEIVEKENISKLGMRSFERRLMRVEEATFQTARNIMDIRQLLVSSLLPAESNENLLGIPESRLKSASDGALNRENHVGERDARIRRWKGKTGGSYPPMKKPMVHDMQGSQDTKCILDRDSDLLRQNPEVSIERVSPRTGRRKLVSSKNFDDGSLELKAGGGMSSKDSSADSERAMHIDSHSAESSGESDHRPLTPDKEDGLKTFGSPTRGVPKVYVEPGKNVTDIKRNHSHKVLRLSTFERYLSMVAPNQDIDNPRPGPIRRQVGADAARGKDNHPDRLLGTTMRHIDSESNMSVYSTNSVQSPKLGTMQRPMPYVSAPMYSTITDHIDLSSVNASRLHELGASTSSTGYISMNDNIDNDMPASPSPFVRPGMGLDFTPFTSLSIRSDTLGSPAGPDHLRKVEQGCYDMMDDSESDQDQARPRTDIEDEEESGIEFAVRKSSETSQESKEEMCRETTF